MKVVGRALEIAATGYGVALFLAYLAAVIVAFVMSWPIGLAMLIPAVIGIYIWLDT